MVIPPTASGSWPASPNSDQTGASFINIFLLKTMPSRWSTFLFPPTFPKFLKTLPRLLQNHVRVCPVGDRLMPHLSMYTMAVYTTLLDWRGNQPHKKMCCLSCTIVWAACCYYDAATTTTLLLRRCYYDAATTMLLLRRCYYACCASAILGSYYLPTGCNCTGMQVSCG